MHKEELLNATKYLQFKRMRHFLIAKIKNQNKGKMCFHSRSQDMEQSQPINSKVKKT